MMLTFAPARYTPGVPANLTPQYKAAEERFRQATSRDEKLTALREMLALLPKHKGTEKLQADLRRRLAKLEDEAHHAQRGGVHHHDPGHVPREGAGQWVLVGAPNAGKSSLLAALTHAHPEVAAYPFTTHAPLPGMMPFEDVQVQLVDTPALTSEHVEPYMPNLVRGADGVLLVVDVAANDLAETRRVVEALLERARVWPEDRPRPHEASPLLASRPLIVLGNKCDLDDDGVFMALAAEAIGSDLPFRAVSATRRDGLDALPGLLFERLGRVRVYTKEPGKKPDLERPFVLARGATVIDLARAIHKEVAERLKYARVWGAVRFDGQQVDRDHPLADRDVVEIHS